MAYLDDHKAKFESLEINLEIQNRDQLRLKANGGNTIIFTYPPKEEALYLEKLQEISLENNFQLIDVATLLVEYIDQDGWDDFEAYYKDFKTTPHKVFNSDDETIDLMDNIIEAILEADQNDRIPVLVRTGSLYGTGIENLHIMEHESIMELTHPLVVFYPSKIENNTLYFLNFKSASKYRGIVIE